MAIAPLALLAAILLAAILSGVLLVNIIIANYMMAVTCLVAICALGLAVGVFVGTQGRRLDGIDNRPWLCGLDLSDDALENLREIPEGAVMVSVPQACGAALASVVPEPEPDEDRDDFGDDALTEGTGKSLDEILPRIEEAEESQETDETDSDEADQDEVDHNDDMPIEDEAPSGEETPEPVVGADTEQELTQEDDNVADSSDDASQPGDCEEPPSRESDDAKVASEDSPVTDSEATASVPQDDVESEFAGKDDSED